MVCFICLIPASYDEKHQYPTVEPFLSPHTTRMEKPERLTT